MGRFDRIAWLVLIALAAPVRAGVYDPAAPATPLARDGTVAALPLEVFRNAWGEIIQIGVTQPETDARRKGLAHRDELARLPRDGVNLVRLGVTHYRLRDFDAALDALKRAEGQDPRNFFVLSNLGSVYQTLGQPADAARSLEAAADFFPDDWPNAAWFRRCEKVQLQLARRRAREQREQPPGRRRGVEDVDDLFAVKFENPAGEYAVGALPDGEALPADAVAVVQQLLLWLPDDTRLYWLLGELLNATGDPDAAAAIFNECLDARRFDAVKLRARRQAIRAFIAARPEPVAEWVPPTGRLWAVGGLSAVAAAVLLGLQLRQWVRPRRDAGR